MQHDFASLYDDFRRSGLSLSAYAKRCDVAKSTLHTGFKALQRQQTTETPQNSPSPDTQNGARNAMSSLSSWCNIRTIAVAVAIGVIVGAGLWILSHPQ